MKPADAARYYDDFSRRYDDPRGAGYHALIDELETEVLRPLVADKDVLELGCGTGLILDRVGPLCRRVVGVDISAGMLSKARTRGHSVFRADLSALPFKDASFDVVFSFKVLAHIPDIGGALAEAARVTRPGGALVLEFYNPLSLRFLVKRLSGPGKISERRTEADMYTRWDPPWRILRFMPPGVQLVDLKGVRVLTPFAGAHRVPGLGALLARSERRAVDSPFRFFGGFVVAILRRV